jgi:hypothetical protein
MKRATLTFQNRAFRVLFWGMSFEQARDAALAFLIQGTENPSLRVFPE